MNHTIFFLTRCFEAKIVTNTGFELVKQNRFAKIYGHSVEKGPAQAKNALGFANHFMKNAKSFN